MLAYKLGSTNMSLERDGHCPSAQWLGLRSAHVSQSPLGSLPLDSYQSFTPRDRALIPGLAARLAVRSPSSLTRELELMSRHAYKVEIEALYCRGFDFLSSFIIDNILHYDEDDLCAESQHCESRGKQGGVPTTARASVDIDHGSGEGTRTYSVGSNSDADDNEHSYSELDMVQPWRQAETDDEDHAMLLESPPDW